MILKFLGVICIMSLLNTIVPLLAIVLKKNILNTFFSPTVLSSKSTLLQWGEEPNHLSRMKDLTEMQRRNLGDVM